MSTTSKGLGDRIASARLYGICDLGYVSVEQAARVSRELLEGGVEILQLRAKGYDPQDLFALACELKALCTEFAVPFVVNDHLELARKWDKTTEQLGRRELFLAKGSSLGVRPTASIKPSMPSKREPVTSDLVLFIPLRQKKGDQPLVLMRFPRWSNKWVLPFLLFALEGLLPKCYQKS
jgi:hypothetical protein